MIWTCMPVLPIDTIVSCSGTGVYGKSVTFLKDTLPITTSMMFWTAIAVQVFIL